MSVSLCVQKIITIKISLKTFNGKFFLHMNDIRPYENYSLCELGGGWSTILKKSAISNKTVSKLKDDIINC